MGDQPEPTTNEPTDDQSQFLGQLVGEGKKYSTPEELAKAYFNANGFIDHLKTESGQLREELDKYMTLEDILKTQQVTKQKAPEVVDPVETPPVEAPKVGVEAEEDLGAKVRKILNEENETRTVTANLDKVTARIMDVYGDADKAGAEVSRKAAELGLSTQFLLDVAAKSPKAFYDLVGLTEVKPTPTSGPKGDINTSALRSSNPGNAKPNTYAYFEVIRKENPRAYFSAKLQNEMFKQASTNPDFYT